MTFTDLWPVAARNCPRTAPSIGLSQDRADCCKRPVSQSFGTTLKPWRRRDIFWKIINREFSVHTRLMRKAPWCAPDLSFHAGAC